MPRRIIKIISLLLIASLNWISFSSIFYTVAYFNDSEESLDNNLSVGTLDFYLIDLSGDFSPEVTPDGVSTRDISVENNGSLDFQYTIKTGNAEGDLCDNISLAVKRDGLLVPYIANLKDFNYNANQFFNPDSWQFIATMTSDNPGLENQTCTFDIIFDGIQMDGSGFTDQEVISNTIISGEWSIPPENLPTPDGLGG